MTLRPFALLWPRALREAAGDREDLLAEVLAAARETGGSGGFARRWLFEAADALLVGFRLRPAAARLALAGAAVIAAALIVRAPDRDAAPSELLVQATDPAGDFSLTLRDGVIAAATLGATPVPATQLVQTADSIRILDAVGRQVLAVEYVPPATIRWAPRAAVLQ